MQITLNNKVVQSMNKNRLKNLQRHFNDFCIERGWNKNTIYETWLLFTEEVGELAKGIRDTNKLYDDKGKDPVEVRANLESEFADVFTYLLHLANDLDIDLEKAYWDKFEINKNRNWSDSNNTVYLTFNEFYDLNKQSIIDKATQLGGKYLKVGLYKFAESIYELNDTGDASFIWKK